MAADAAAEVVARCRALAAVSDEPGGGNVMVSMPRGLLQRVGEEPASGLSERETEVVVLAARGFSNARIARELHLAEATVKRHLANVYEKMGVRSRGEAAREALLRDWITIEEIKGPAPWNGQADRG